MTDLSHLAITGATFGVRVTPGSRRAGLDMLESVIRISVTAPPRDGRATEAGSAALAKALGVAKTRLTRVRGETARGTLFRLAQTAARSSR